MWMHTRAACESVRQPYMSHTHGSPLPHIRTMYGSCTIANVHAHSFPSPSKATGQKLSANCIGSSKNHQKWVVCRYLYLGCGHWMTNLQEWIAWMSVSVHISHDVDVVAVMCTGLKAVEDSTQTTQHHIQCLTFSSYETTVWPTNSFKKFQLWVSILSSSPNFWCENQILSMSQYDHL